MGEVNEHGQPVGPAVAAFAPPPVPDLATLEGDSVTLVPLTVEHAPGLFAAACAPGDEARWTYMPFGPFASESEVRDWVEAHLALPDAVPLAILDAASGAVLGTATWLRITPAAATIEVGWIMYGPALARTRGATEAMYLMMARAFDLGYRRYEWKCDALNEPSRRAAERLGFTFEGVHRQALVYKGRNRDTAWYSITDAEWPALRDAYRQWLDATPLTGPQTLSLSTLTTRTNLC